jgi:PAS domain S-box-containing protein
VSAGATLICAYLVSALLSTASAFMLFRLRRTSPGALEFAIALALETTWTLAGIVELRSPTLASKIFWDNAQLLPALFVPLAILFFALAYVGRTPDHPIRALSALSIVPLACASFVFTDPLHQLARATAHIVPAQPFDVLMYEFSAVENFAWLYTYLLLIVSTVLFVRRIVSEHSIFRFQTGVALFATLLPSAASVLMLFDVRLFGQRDFSPLVFGVSGVLIVTALSRRQLFDLVPIARDRVIESVSDAVIILDTRDRFVDLNASARTVFGRPLDALLGHEVRAAAPELAALLDARSAGGKEQHELKFSMQDEERTYEAVVSEVASTPGVAVGTVVLLRDVTERRAAEDALRRLNDELEARVGRRTRELSVANDALSSANDALTLEMSERVRAERERSALELQLQAAQKMESMGRLAGGVAHDFNNLLTAIICSVELIGRRAKDDPKILDLLDPVRRASESAAGLTRQLLAFSRNQIVEPKHLDVDASIERVRQMLDRIIGEDVRLGFEPGSGGAHLKCDVGQLEQLILNLAVNARDAMHLGGAITLGTTRMEVAVARTCTDGSTLEPGGYVTITVADTGTGIPPEVLAQMFDPFFTTKPEGRGTGLGLAVVRDVVRQHGGSIDVTTTVGVGTTFSVHFPRVEPPSGLVADDAKGGEAPRGVERILLVEDQALVRDAIARTLERLGYSVIACDTAKAGLAHLEERWRDVDLLVTDVVLADGSGRSLVESARAFAPDLAVLYVSGYTDDVVLRHGIAHGELNYLAKPFTEWQLATAVRHALASRA